MARKKTEVETKALMYVEDKLTVQDAPRTTATEAAHPLAEALGDFLQRIDDIYFAVKVMVPASADILNRRMKKVRKTIEEAEQKIRNGTPAEAGYAGAEIVEAGYESDRIYRSRLPDLIERSLFVNLFSEFDYFFGILLRELYRRRPDLLASLSRQISFDELLKFESLESVKESVLDAEIESIRRESYVEQFSILQRKFGLPLTKFQEWPQFVESAQRRNLMVHCGGHVSEQYLQVCESAGYKFDTRPVIGELLTLGHEYFSNTSSLVSRVAFMLTHTLWRKVLPTESENANSELNDQIYRLLCAKRWQIAADLGTFSLSEPMCAGTSDMQYRIRLCNTAIALKNLKRGNEMKRLLDSIDWTASIRDFRLAVAILRDERDDAVSLMKQIGKKGELIHEVAYHQWPLFGGFRETLEFQKSYEEIYGYPFYRKAEEKAGEAKSKLDEVIASESPSRGVSEQPIETKNQTKSTRTRRKKVLESKSGDHALALQSTGP